MSDTNMWRPLHYFTYYKNQAAKKEVLDFLISCCEASPMADDPSSWVEEMVNPEFGAQELKHAMIEIKQFLESTKVNLP